MVSQAKPTVADDYVKRLWNKYSKNEIKYNSFESLVAAFLQSVHQFQQTFVIINFVYYTLT